MKRLLILILFSGSSMSLHAQSESYSYTVVASKVFKKGELVYALPPEIGDTVPNLIIANARQTDSDHYNTVQKVTGSVTDSAAVIGADTGLLIMELNKQGKIKFYTFVSKHCNPETAISYNACFGKPLHLRTDGSEMAVIWQVKKEDGTYFGVILTSSVANGSVLRVGL